MNLMEEIQSNSGIEINEGIKFGKTSKKLKKYQVALERKSNKAKAKNPEAVKDMVPINNQLKSLIKDFEKIENAFEVSSNKIDKSKLKTQHKELERKYIDLLRLVKKEKNVKSAKTIGIIGLLALTVIGVFFSVEGIGLINDSLQHAKLGSMDLIAGKKVDDIGSKFGDKITKAATSSGIMQAPETSAGDSLTNLLNKTNKESSYLLSRGERILEKSGEKIAQDAPVLAGGVASTGIGLAGIKKLLTTNTRKQTKLSRATKAALDDIK